MSFFEQFHFNKSSSVDPRTILAVVEELQDDEELAPLVSEIHAYMVGLHRSQQRAIFNKAFPRNTISKWRTPLDFLQDVRLHLEEKFWAACTKIITSKNPVQLQLFESVL